MARGRITGLSAGEAVLGLVIEQPDHGYSLERRLEERFGAAQFGYSTAYSALRRMHKEGLVRTAPAQEPGLRELEPAPGEEVATVGQPDATVGETAAARSERGAAGGEEVVYEATPEGVAYFRKWLRAPTSMPALREELHAKIALCEPRDLPRLIEVVHMEELACIAELDRLRERMVAERGARRPLAQTPWSDLMDRSVVHAQAAFWGGRIKQLGLLRAYLQDLRPEAERRVLRERRDAYQRQHEQTHELATGEAQRRRLAG